MPIGMLIKKHARHELSSMLNCTSAPSISCAASATRPIAALYMPIALRRPAPWKETPMIARTCGINIAPATPWARPRRSARSRSAPGRTLARKG